MLISTKGRYALRVMVDLAEHAADYGFILRYPSDKTEATGMDYEPWHYRYVGREYAQAIRQSGLCLEEFLQR